MVEGRSGPITNKKLPLFYSTEYYYLTDINLNLQTQRFPWFYAYKAED